MLFYRDRIRLTQHLIAHLSKKSASLGERTVKPTQSLNKLCQEGSRLTALDSHSFWQISDLYKHDPGSVLGDGFPKVPYKPESYQFPIVVYGAGVYGFHGRVRRQHN
jgi:hypothetical protein